MGATGRLALLALLALLGCSTQAGDVVVADASSQPPVDVSPPADTPPAMDRVAPADVPAPDVPAPDVPAPDVPAPDLPSSLDAPRADVPTDVPADAARRCQGPADCMGNPGGALCDVGTGRCVACLDDLACPADAHCLRAEGRCAPGCSRDEGCAATPDTRRCDTAEHRCVACLDDTHCAGGNRCVSGQCRPACDGTRPCGMGLTCCDNACVDITATLAHCGACGARCAPANATGACAAGRCAVAACAAGFADCNSSAGDGCEADTRVSSAHCGRCGNPCAAGLSCVNGACQMVTDPTMLRLDVRTHTVAGTVTMNGAMPTSTCSSSARATVRFVDAARNYDISIPVPCNGATTPFTFSGTVYPGTYRVTVTGGLSSLPGASYVVYESLSLGL